MRFLIHILILFSSSVSVAQNSGRDIPNFAKAKKLAFEIHKENPVTIYCPCKYSGRSIDLRSCGYKIQKDAKRAARVEWEHVVPAEAFGQSFTEWRTGDAEKCIRKGKRFKGRKCAEKNAEFSKMESDLYNLWPSIGELNNLRSNFSMAEISEKSNFDFGGCKAIIADRKFEPMDADKGRIARVYKYMDESYPGRGIISEKNKKLFDAWDKLYPVDEWECKRAQKIEKAQGNKNSILLAKCPAESGLKLRQPGTVEKSIQEPL